MSLPPFSETTAGGSIPTNYSPAGAPLNAEGYPVYVQAELAKIAKAISTLINLAPQAATRAPKKPIEPMIRFSKAPWRPVGGQTTDRWVTYVGGNWVYLNSV